MATKSRFQVGDVIHVTKYDDPNNDQYGKEGVVLITAIDPLEGCENVVYDIKLLKGNLTFVAYNNRFFDIIPYLVWLGNVNDDSMLKVLYGSKG